MYNILLSIFTVAAIIFCSFAAMNKGDFTGALAQDTLIAIVVIIRFLDGYISPLLFESVTELYPNTSIEKIQWMSAIEKVSTLIGVWIAYILVETGTIS